MVTIDTELVAKLIKSQFPEWSHLDIKPVEKGGNDNRSFHLGKTMSVRLPSAERYVPQVEKEQLWLPLLSKHLSLPITTPLAKGEPSAEYPYPWSINKWLDGESLSIQNVADLNQLANDLAKFLVELQSIDAGEGPAAGKHNFYRGGDIAVYDEEARRAIYENTAVFDEHLLTEMLTEIWELALASQWKRAPVWVHGDIAPGNLLVQNGRLSGVIDFGILGVGDPACDAAMAWTFFDRSSRTIFKETLKFDDETWNRARGWALWKALITYSYNKQLNKAIADEAFTIIKGIVNDYEAGR